MLWQKGMHRNFRKHSPNKERQVQVTLTCLSKGADEHRTKKLRDRTRHGTIEMAVVTRRKPINRAENNNCIET